MHRKGVEGLELSKERLLEIHQDFNEKKFELIWDSAHGDFKKIQKIEDIVAFYSSIQNRLGFVQYSENIDWHVSSGSDHIEVYLRQKTVIGKESVVEDFTFKVENGQALLYDYSIESNAILLE